MDRSVQKTGHTGRRIGACRTSPPYCKSQLGAFQNVPTKSTVFMSVKDRDKTVLLISTPRQLSGFGFSTISTAGTAAFLAKQGIEVDTIHRMSEGKPNILDAIHGGNVQLIINTPSGKIPRQDEVVIRDDQERKWNRNFDIRDNLFHQLCGDISLLSDSTLPVNPWGLSRTEGLRLDQPLQRFLAGIEILRRLTGE
jgi:hypothetical protein